MGSFVNKIISYARRRGRALRPHRPLLSIDAPIQPRTFCFCVNHPEFSSAGRSRQSITLISVRKSRQSDVVPAGGAECLRLTELLTLKHLQEGSKQAAIQHQMNNKLYFYRRTEIHHLFHKLMYEMSTTTRFHDPYLCKWFILGHNSFHFI